MWSVRPCRLDDSGLAVSTTQVGPPCFAVQIVTAVSKRLFGEHQPVGMSVRKSEPVLVQAGARAHRDLSLQSRRGLVPGVQLIVRPTLPGDELLEAS